VAKKPTNKWLVTVSISFGTLMGAIDSSIVNVALPHIQGAVGATVQEITWIATGYAVALVVGVYMASLVLFLIGSALCGTASTLPALVAFRALQGFGAGALQPTEQAILRTTRTSSPRSRSRGSASLASSSRSRRWRCRTSRGTGWPTRRGSSRSSVRSAARSASRSSPRC
jgi:DHA2 family multidrug resistance protein